MLSQEFLLSVLKHLSKLPISNVEFREQIAYYIRGNITHCKSIDEALHDLPDILAALVQRWNELNEDIKAEEVFYEEVCDICGATTIDVIEGLCYRCRGERGEL